MEHHYSDIPTWDNGEWTTTHFDTHDEFRGFILLLFKEPGKYEFDETSYLFNEQARRFKNTKRFCQYVEGSRDFRAYWDAEKAKCRYGVIFKNNNKTWYVDRAHYMFINFLKINDKVKKKFDFPDLMDAQYHMALYELLAELHYKHAAVVKKRQIGSSYFHMAKIINLLWFEESPVLKIGASLKDYINDKGSWKFLEEFRSFLNKHTAWYRPMTPSKVLMWQQQIEDTDKHGRATMVGLKGTVQGTSFEQDPTSGVGGACRMFFHEEGGIAPRMDKTVEYLFPAMEMGDYTTGLFVAAGSVGELTACEPLKHMMYFPEENSIYPVITNLLDEKGTIGISALFIPEQWSMPPYVDAYGNSLVEDALKALGEKMIQWKKDLKPEIYQLRVSQHPRSIAEAFDFREVSIFPIGLVNHQKRRIEEKEYSLEAVELERDGTGKIVSKSTTKLPISEFPISKKTEDKTGVIIVHEKPIPGAEWGTYYGSIDPVSEGKTTTSESLCSIYIYKRHREVTRQDEDGNTEVFIEQDKIVCWWTGRFDDINKTHERLEMIIEWYNAWTVVENNVSLFILYMIAKHKQRYLVPKDQMLFLKELGSNMNSYQEYGWRNVGTIFKTHIISYFIEFLKEEIDVETKADGTPVKVTYGIERIPDIMVMQEMKGYAAGVNVDRLVAIASLIAFAKVQLSNLGYKKTFETKDKKHLEKSENLYKLSNSPFRHIGRNNNPNSSMRPPRSPFKNLR
jgi:hypothetical protein